MDLILLGQDAAVMERFFDKDMIALTIPIVAMVVGLIIAVISIVVGGIRAIVVGRAREQTRRELAAYVAEGTLDADKAVAILNAGEDLTKKC
ncbi:MAG: hypothetical protein HRU76_02485 [Phycisphaeraceae bacterium]|nr:MAG: hypothetical protein HRU76_02485 [Phycisphaeraceae bacterium]